MKGLKVKCPNCGRTDFITTDKFNPDVRPNGGMVRCVLPYHIDWLTTSSTVCAEMTCPECLAQLAPSGVLNVLVPARECGQFFEVSSWKQWNQDDIDKEAAKINKLVNDAFDSVITPLKSFPPGEDRIAIPLEEPIAKDGEIVPGPMEILESLGEKIQQNDPPPVMSKSVEKRLEVQMGKKRGKVK